MIRGNFHTHTTFCDGKSTAQEMADRALELGFTHLGFSGHVDPEIKMDLEAYTAEIRRLQTVERGRLDILCGAEVDTLFVPQSRKEEKLLARLDYRIGSTHYIEAPSGGPMGCVDDTPERLATFCREEFGGDHYRMARAYYETEARTVERTACTFIGHFDLVTRFNDAMHFLDEEDRRYTAPALECMEYLVSGCAFFEINCGAVNRGRKAEFYPNRFLLRNLKKMGGQILIGSDAHDSALLNGGFAAAARTAVECGFTHTWFLEHDQSGRVVFREVPLE